MGLDDEKPSQSWGLLGHTQCSCCGLLQAADTITFNPLHHSFSDAETAQGKLN